MGALLHRLSRFPAVSECILMNLVARSATRLGDRLELSCATSERVEVVSVLVAELAYQPKKGVGRRAQQRDRRILHDDSFARWKKRQGKIVVQVLLQRNR